MIFRLHDSFKFLNKPPKIPATLHAQGLPDIIPKRLVVRVTNSTAGTNLEWGEKWLHGYPFIPHDSSYSRTRICLKHGVTLWNKWGEEGEVLMSAMGFLFFY